VHYQNTEVLINALVAANRPFEMMEYPNRTHCICQGKGTQAHLFDHVSRFLDRNLLHGAPMKELQERANAGE
jgi:dipeptidyl-peptidase-4